MSLILDALKKAERQHKLGEVPGIGAQPAPASTMGMRGMGWIMLLLLACVMLGLGLYLGGFRLMSPAEETATLPPNEAAQPQQATPLAPHPLSPPPSETQPLATAPLPKPPPIQPPLPKPARPLDEMPSGFVANLPTINIDIHSYDQHADKRYVLINMEKYHEGDYLAEGPQLIEILTDGVVLEHLGERFILPIGNQ